MNLKEKALQDYQEEVARNEQQEQKRLAGMREENIRQLIERIQKFFGEEVEFEIVYDAEADQQKAILKDIPEAFFTLSRQHYEWLTMSPNLVIPEGPEYEEWWENPDNCNRPEWGRVKTLRDVGYYLSLWQEADWETKPWPKTEPTEIKPKRFDELTLGQANNEKRPFKVLSVTNNEYGDVSLVVEYLDIEEE